MSLMKFRNYKVIVNVDQTPPEYVATSNVTMAEKVTLNLCYNKFSVINMQLLLC